MVTVGITGGIGSGKSTVCRIWSDLGAEVLDADLLARSLMNESDEIRSRIIEEFGAEAYGSDGALNRPFLAREAFAKIGRASCRERGWVSGARGGYEKGSV